MITGADAVAGTGVWVGTLVFSIVMAGRAMVCVAVGAGVSEAAPPPQPDKNTSIKREEAVNHVENLDFMGSILPQPIKMQNIVRLYYILLEFRLISPGKKTGFGMSYIISIK